MTFSYITNDERSQIEGYLKAGHSKREIATLLGRNYATICREIKRGTVMLIEEKTFYREYAVYKADYAQTIYEENARRKGRKAKLDQCPDLKDYVEDKVLLGYSPEVITFFLSKTQSRFSVSICFKTIYNTLDRKAFKRITNKDLPYRKDHKKKTHKQAQKPVPSERRSIEERPSFIANRVQFGHWEMDCILSGLCTTSKEALLVLTERMTRFSYVAKLPRKTQACVQAVLDDLEQRLQGRFKQTFKTITMDNGTEFINQKLVETSCFQNKKRVTAYYCHPFSSFERGSNENWNRFVRRFIPKGSAIKNYSKMDICHIVDFINNYPRKMFDFHSSLYCLKKEAPDLAFLLINRN